MSGQRFEIKAGHIEAIKKSQAPAGSLGLPELLDQRRIEYSIPDGAFRTQAVFDRVFVHQIPNKNQESYGGGPILKAETTASKERDESCRGVLVSAGFMAMDHLRANGIDVGHVVEVLRLAPWRKHVDTVAGKDLYVLVMRDGDIIGSEDLRQDLLSRPNALRFDTETATHIFTDKNGVEHTPTRPEIPADY
jgi:hypothetical protein